jgi:hypothetical protein
MFLKVWGVFTHVKDSCMHVAYLSDPILRCEAYCTALLKD